MEIVASYSGIRRYGDDYQDGQLSHEAGTVFELLLCPACDAVSLRSYFWHDGAMDPSDIEFKTLYPPAIDQPIGLPEEVARLFDSAQQVRDVNANAYSVLLGRLLETICNDRGAPDGTLAERLAVLAANNEIPDNLVKVAAALRHLRNVGAHANLGDLSSTEVPVLDRLCRALLEYVYSAPELAREAEACLADLKNKAD